MVQQHAKTGLDHSHTCLPTLVSSCTWRFVVMGWDHGILAQCEVDLQDAVLHIEYATGR